MTLELKYLGMIAEAVGKQEEQLTISVKTVEGLCDYLITEHEQLKNHKFKIAVNHKLVESNFLLNNNDEVALLPPFAGG